MRTIAATALAALIAGTAHADWEKTRWGMSPEQVKATDPTLVAADIKLRRNNLHPLLSGRYSAGDFSFRSDFQFDDEGHLAMVGLNLDQYGKCRDLSSALQSKYGTPADDKTSRFGRSVTWNDKINENIVTLNDITSIEACSIIYTKLDTKAMNGL